MRAILSAPGSRGDVNPMLAIGKALAERGHDVVISLAEPYAPLAESLGLKAVPVISTERFTEVLGQPHVWKPIRGGLIVFRELVGKFLELHQQVIREHHVKGDTVLVAHPLDMVSRIVRDADPSTPMVSIHPAPVILRTLDDPPRLSPWWFEISRPQWALSAAYWFVDQFVIDRILRGPVNRMRASYGLAPVRRVFHEWWLSPDRSIAMYPEWFAPATKNVSRLVHASFPLFDVDGGDFEMPTNRPIAFTAGTAHHGCREFLEAAVESCLAMQRPGLLLSTFADNFPPDLPPSVQTMPYASFGRLLPQCSAIVHHGGIGTTSQAFAAGIPQVISPFAFDQFDNATRVERLRCGRWLRRPAQLTETLRAVLDDAERDPTPLNDTSARLQGVNGAEIAAEVIEQTRRSG